MGTAVGGEKREDKEERSQNNDVISQNQFAQDNSNEQRDMVDIRQVHKIDCEDPIKNRLAKAGTYPIFICASYSLLLSQPVTDEGKSWRAQGKDGRQIMGRILHEYGAGWCASVFVLALILSSSRCGFSQRGVERNAVVMKWTGQPSIVVVLQSTELVEFRGIRWN